MKLTKEQAEKLLQIRELVCDFCDELGLDGTKNLFGDVTQGELQKQKHHKEAPEGLKRIKRIFGHRDSTIPNKAEMKVYNALAKRLGKNCLYEQIETMTSFYKFRKIELERGNSNLWSTSAMVLMNKWDEVLDRATSFLETKPKSTSSKPSKGLPEPQGDWRAVGRKMFEGSGNEARFTDDLTWEVCGNFAGGSVQRDIYNEMR